MIFLAQMHNISKSHLYPLWSSNLEVCGYMVYTSWQQVNVNRQGHVSIKRVFYQVYQAGIARHRGFASLTHSKSQSRIVVTSAAAHGRIVKTVKKVTTYMVGTVKQQNTSSSEHSWRKIAETRQSLFWKSAWSGYAHKMCTVDSNTKRLYSNEMSDRAIHFTVFMIMNCPVEQQILAAYGSI